MSLSSSSLSEPWSCALYAIRSLCGTLRSSTDVLDFGALPDMDVRLQAQGGMGALFAVTARGATFILKVNKTVRPAKKGDGAAANATVDTIADVCRYEADVTRFLWDALACTGASAHVVCPYAVVRTAMPKALGFGTHPVRALAMEKLSGLRSVDGTVMYNLQDLLVEGMQGKVHDFDTVFRVVMFQVLYTVTTWTYLTDGLFRHNDLYARNVGLSTFESKNDDASSPSLPSLPSLTYVVYCHPSSRGDPFLKTTFGMHTAMRAVVLDFGWSALLPRLGPDFDTRFYQRADASGSRECRMQVKDLIASSGMSQARYSHHYDCTLLMVSVYMITSRRAESGLPPVLQEFRALYRALYGNLHLSDMMHAGPLVGRLTNEAQRALNDDAKLVCRLRPSSSKHAAHAAPFTVLVPKARDLILNPFFSKFRRTDDCADMAATASAMASARPTITFGIDMGSSSPAGDHHDPSSVITPTKITTPCLQNFDATSPIAPIKGAPDSSTCFIDGGSWRQPMGAYDDLLGTMSRIRERYRRMPVRCMTPHEATSWVPSTPKPVAVKTGFRDKLKRKRRDVSNEPPAPADVEPRLHQRPLFSACTPDCRDAPGTTVFKPCTPASLGCYVSPVYFKPLTPFVVS